jgi:tight adherence protein B
MSTLLAMMCAVGLLMIYTGITGQQRRPAQRWDRFERRIEESGVSGLSGGRFLSLTVVVSVVTFFLVAGITSSAVVGLVFAGLAGWSPWAWLTGRRTRRAQQISQAWPDVLGSLIASIRAGVSLPEALLYQRTRVPDALRPAFDSFSSAYRASGSFLVGLDALRSSASDPIADRVVVALSITHDVGGTDVVRTLRTLSDFVRDDLRTRAEVLARWSWTVVAARLAAAAPWLVLFMMSTRPEAARVYGSTTGVAVITVGGLATVTGYRLMLRAARLPGESRLSR